MNEQLEQALAQIAEEKGISREEIIEMIEASLAAAFRKDFGDKDQNIVVKFNPEDLSAKIYDEKTVVPIAQEEIEDQQKEISIDEAQSWQKGVKAGEVVSKEITRTDGMEFGR
ncbi:TPA: transcription termination/antitermination protein NusA, partial [Patescibacteria group bacterium]|nr:transcription termination/antitermination protein NusA [Patescibacteria group bacterium]